MPDGSQPPVSNDEFRTLQEMELRARIAEHRRWWPAAIGPLATVLATVGGVAWGMWNGFFDVSRRELEVRKRELNAEMLDLRNARDQQSAQFALDKKKQESELAELKQHARTLERAIALMDTPVITDATFGGAAEASDFQLRMADVTIEGTRFGASPGTVTLSYEYHYATDVGSTHTNSVPLTTHVVAWSESSIVVRPGIDENHPLISATLGAPRESRAVSYDIVATVRRTDGKVSNPHKTALAQTAHLHDLEQRPR